jgi:hypothetical protein
MQGIAESEENRTKRKGMNNHPSIRAATCTSDGRITQTNAAKPQIFFSHLDAFAD